MAESGFGWGQSGILAAALITFGLSGIILHNCLVCAAIQTASTALVLPVGASAGAAARAGTRRLMKPDLPNDSIRTKSNI